MTPAAHTPSPATVLAILKTALGKLFSFEDTPRLPLLVLQVPGLCPFSVIPTCSVLLQFCTHPVAGADTVYTTRPVSGHPPTTLCP